MVLAHRKQEQGRELSSVVQAAKAGTLVLCNQHSELITFNGEVIRLESICHDRGDTGKVWKDMSKMDFSTACRQHCLCNRDGALAFEGVCTYRPS